MGNVGNGDDGLKRGTYDERFYNNGSYEDKDKNTEPRNFWKDRYRVPVSIRDSVTTVQKIYGKGLTERKLYHVRYLKSVYQGSPMSRLGFPTKQK